MKSPKLAILFWFYKEHEICVNRLQLLKKYNPNLVIFGLYGGKQENEKSYKEKLGNFLDDFYTSPFTNSDWKWINGDLVLLDWYDKRGRNLEFDSAVVVQWDMLVFDSLENQFKGIAKDQIFLSGLKKLDNYTENNWDWTRPGREERKNYLNYIRYVSENYQYNHEPVCCLFVLEVFPRIFFEKYLKIKNKEFGMLEYKVPIYSEIFNIPFFEKDLGVHWWGNVKTMPMNAEPTEIETRYINKELGKKNGWRIFHPYFKKWNLSPLD